MQTQKLHRPVNQDVYRILIEALFLMVLSLFRWWPAQICYPDEIPERILNLTHSLCEFPVMFFGSRDYAWLHSGRVFKYEEGDKGGNLNGNVSLAKYFKKGLFYYA